MRLKDVPARPAYLVFHDAFDNGSMDVFGYDSLEEAEVRAAARNRYLEENGLDEAGVWKAYVKLPRKKVFCYYEVG